MRRVVVLVSGGRFVVGRPGGGVGAVVLQIVGGGWIVGDGFEGVFPIAFEVFEVVEISEVTEIDVVHLLLLLNNYGSFK